MVESAEYTEFRISELYVVINEQEVFPVLHIDDRDVMLMLKPFVLLIDEYKTVISQNIWNCHVQKQKHSVLPLPEVARIIWTPVYTEIQELVEKLYNNSITLMEIDHYLVNIQNLEEEICTLVKGYNFCLDSSMPTAWVSQFVEDINYYTDVCKAKIAAELVLTTKDALMLKGTFETLEMFRSKVNIKMYNTITNCTAMLLLVIVTS